MAAATLGVSEDVASVGCIGVASAGSVAAVSVITAVAGAFVDTWVVSAQGVATEASAGIVGITVRESIFRSRMSTAIALDTVTVAISPAAGTVTAAATAVATAGVTATIDRMTGL